MMRSLSRRIESFAQKNRLPMEMRMFFLYAMWASLGLALISIYLLMAKKPHPLILESKWSLRYLRESIFLGLFQRIYLALILSTQSIRI